MSRINQRMESHGVLSKHLAGFSEEQLIFDLETSAPHHEGIGGTSRILTIDNAPIFVKKIPLTDLERLPENWRSTANLFNLPTFYHYGVGSAGYSAWRELAAHEMATQWVLEGQCASFPLLYHWRVIESPGIPLNEETRDQIEADVAYWEGSDAVRKRLEALYKASAHLYLFLEYIPANLYDWLQKAEPSAIQFVESSFLDTCAFMRSKDFVHFDAHFQNILTDGEEIYFSDFGLCLSREFALVGDEKVFLQNHRLFDEASVSVNLLHGIISSRFGREGWISILKACLSGAVQLHPAVMEIVRRHANVALTMDEFYGKLQKLSKTTPFPITDDAVITIRRAELCDAESIAKVHVTAWQESYQGIYDEAYLASLSYEMRLPYRTRILESPSPQVFHIVALDKDQIIGFCDAGPCQEAQEGVLGEVYAIYLLNGYKRRGLGTSLMKRAEAFLREQNLTPYVVWSLEENLPARHLYEKFGGVLKLEKIDSRSGRDHKVVGYAFD